MCNEISVSTVGLVSVQTDTLELQTVECLQENRTLVTARTNIGK